MEHLVGGSWASQRSELDDPAAFLLRSPNHSQPCEIDGDRRLANIAAAFYQARQRRKRQFHAELLSDPAWDMLLDLFVHKALGKRVSTMGLCLAADVPGATGLRWIARLERHQLAHRFRVAEDRRLALVEITPKGYKLMRAYVSGEAARTGDR